MYMLVAEEHEERVEKGGGGWPITTTRQKWSQSHGTIKGLDQPWQFKLLKS